MTINITAFETSLQQRLNSLGATAETSDYALLAKAVEQLETTTTSSYATFNDLPVAADYEGRVVHVRITNRIYYSDGAEWIMLATSQNPDFTRARLEDEVVPTQDFGLITQSVTSSADFAGLTTTATEAQDKGYLRIGNKGIAAEIYIDPLDWAFTIYDGETRNGIKHMRADRNNQNFETMSAHNQGIAHLIKSNNTTAPSGTPTPIPFNITQINDTRMGHLTSNGFYKTNFEGWYEVTVDGYVSGNCWVGLGTAGDYNDGYGTTAQGPDMYTQMYLNRDGAFEIKRMVYAPINTEIVLYLTGPDAGASRVMYGDTATNPNKSFKYFTQMNLRFLGSDTATNSYQV